MHVCVISTGLPSAPSLRWNPHSSRRGPTHYPEGPKPSAATVGPAGLRVRGECTGCQPPRDSAALQQHQRAVPEQLGMTSDTPTGSLTAVKQGAQLGCCVGKAHRADERIVPKVLSRLRRNRGKGKWQWQEKSERHAREKRVTGKKKHRGMIRLGKVGMEWHEKDVCLFFTWCVLKATFQCKAYTLLLCDNEWKGHLL